MDSISCWGPDPTCLVVQPERKIILKKGSGWDFGDGLWSAVESEPGNLRPGVTEAELGHGALAPGLINSYAWSLQVAGRKALG